MRDLRKSARLGECIFGDGQTDRYCVICSDEELTIYVCAGACWKAHRQSRGHRGFDTIRLNMITSS
jgi:hypothetical protein